MTDDDDGRISDVDRRSMRILATSTKAAGPANTRIADRLERAAGTGDPDDYRRAEASFDALPARERRRIGTHAERQAESQRRLEDVRRTRKAEPDPVPKRRMTVDETLDWKPMLPDHSPATDEPDEPAARPTGRPRPAVASPPAVPRPAVPRPAGSPRSQAPAALDPIEELRRQILGDDSKPR